MIYYQDEDILIRDMVPADAQIFTDGEIAQGWHATVEKYEMRLRDQAAGRAVSLVAGQTQEADKMIFLALRGLGG